MYHWFSDSTIFGEKMHFLKPQDHKGDPPRPGPFRRALSMIIGEHVKPHDHKGDSPWPGQFRRTLSTVIGEHVKPQDHKGDSPWPGQFRRTLSTVIGEHVKPQDHKGDPPWTGQFRCDLYFIIHTVLHYYMNFDMVPSQYSVDAKNDKHVYSLSRPPLKIKQIWSSGIITFKSYKLLTTSP
jgi:hypothetical protein